METAHVAANLTEKDGSTAGMVLLEGGTYLMGTDSEEGFPADGEGPVREVTVDSFYIDRCAVTNSDFAQFIDATGYTTDAEKYGWSFVFYLFVSKQTEKEVLNVVRETPWWWAVKHANWKKPEGPDSTIHDRMDHPAVHISWNDAVRYCEWAGKRLPTEAEWEYAARGGLKQKRFPWGDALYPDGEHACNIWQGSFPTQNEGSDGFLATAPSDAYHPNPYGLYNMAGNIWEWCMDWFAVSDESTNGIINPKGPESGESKIIKGGSYLCHDSYCNRYRVAARSSNTPDSSTGNMGFRCVRDV
ncbi:Formylglycine-generating enzyme, required for sulfatase activity, contains SUMF1/FGE domain [Lentibacillus persicus]|uniref:Formylglycine-generating enzyme, required for sulfatase activity, contains SUMF1/FGE domain n=1 Tax=Lentibacillus persicus TaxID=640948 RepID=A0A1I1VXN1_9BACI|nr:formylglycine-generating enzyme family protein [Lentibacillus persicus]SFD87615.1 Formylglycine-generating enzyme, required for sulfatase activity, contains SUMF1/FGE domain [Lentibacillus persicus]